MSRIYLRGSTWWVDFTDELGRRRRMPLRGVLTKGQAKEELSELTAQVRRRKLGLDAAPISLRSTVWALVDWWLKHRCPKASAKTERARLEKHVRGTELGNHQVAHVRSHHFEALFSQLERDRTVDGEKRPPLAGASINHVRAKLRTVFERARREGLYSGVNPVQQTRKRSEQRRIYETLTPEQVTNVLRFSPPQWRGFFAAAFYLGLRKGEVAGLRKADVDLEARTVTVRHSYDRDTTKGGHADVLPLPELMVPFIEAALQQAKGSLLFPDRKGKMRPRESDPHLRLRHALKLAGITGKEELRFHDLRHSTATALLRAGVDVHRVQRIMRHADITTTVTRYAHLVPDDLRESMGALGTGTNQAQITVEQTSTKRRASAK